MPVYNEARTLRTIVDRVLKSDAGLEIELVCVDDASTDGSYEILLELAATDSRIRVFHQSRNQGKGAAIHRAIAEMTGDIANRPARLGVRRVHGRLEGRHGRLVVLGPVWRR